MHTQRLTVVLELTSPILAGERDTDGVNKFRRDASGRIMFPPHCWFSALRAACAQTGTAIPDGSINVSGSLDIYPELTQMQHTVDNRTVSKIHEVLNAGARFDQVVNATAHVDKETIERLITYVGQFVGVSPFGYKQGFGRFRIVCTKEGGAQ